MQMKFMTSAVWLPWKKKYKEWDPVDATFDMAEIKRPKDLADMVPQISLTNDEGKKTVAHLKEKR